MMAACSVRFCSGFPSPIRLGKSEHNLEEQAAIIRKGNFLRCRWVNIDLSIAAAHLHIYIYIYRDRERDRERERERERKKERKEGRKEGRKNTLCRPAAGIQHSSPTQFK